jgi:hypothetical protein
MVNDFEQRRGCEELPETRTHRLFELPVLETGRQSGHSLLGVLFSDKCDFEVVMEKRRGEG